jgi:hypothetical protein
LKQKKEAKRTEKGRKKNRKRKKKEQKKEQKRTQNQLIVNRKSHAQITRTQLGYIDLYLSVYTQAWSSKILFL